jgi:hypothetical protein
MQGEDRVSRYRRFAVACLELARRAGDPSKRALYVSMAQNWIALIKHNFSPELEMARDVFNNRHLSEKDPPAGGHGG